MVYELYGSKDLNNYGHGRYDKARRMQFTSKYYISTLAN